jgi:hypothetical protein
MKTVCLIIGSVFSSFVVSAQIASPGFKNKVPKAGLIDWSTTIAEPKAKLIGQSSLGSIYAMPTDNMPCLIPTTISDNLMPVFMPPASNLFMPNAIPRQNLIPSDLAAHNIFKIKKAPQQTSENLMLNLIRKK